MTASRTILLVDDEPQIHRFLRPTLNAVGYKVDSATTGEGALEKLKDATPELVVLDLGLTDMHGLDVLLAIRQSSTVPVIILSARDNEADKVAALNAGADDYVSKPFSVNELVARIHTALRHAVTLAGTTAVFKTGDVSVDTLAHKVTVRGEVIKLTPREYDLLHLLARHAGRLMTHRFILREVWGPNLVEHAQYLRVFVSRLRQKIELNASDPRILLTESGVGYRLAEPAPSVPRRETIDPTKA